jgi:hypothetical protein
MNHSEQHHATYVDDRDDDGHDDGDNKDVYKQKVIDD